MLAYSRGYYGISLATRTLSGISDQPGKVDFEPAPINQHKLLTPMCHRCPLGLQHATCTNACLETSFELLGHRLDNVAAVIVESVVSAGGMIFPPKDYLQALHAKTKAAGALFIVDEAQTGFGRCGRWFDIEHYDIQPDMIVVSKTAGNGYPAAAVVVSDEVAQKLEQSNFMHLSSHQNDPLAAAAILAVIDTVEEENLVQHSDEVGRYFMEKLRSLQAAHPVVTDVRGRGLMIGMELSSEVDPTVSFRLAMLCEQRGLHITFTYYEPVIRFIPPLIITREEIDRAIAILDECLRLAVKEDGKAAELAPKNPRSGPLVQRMLNPSFDPVKLARKMWRTSPEQWVKKLRGVR
jgi:4-aminobutyrate aminotransferase-like enzyme